MGRHGLVLAIATLLAVAYGTRREEAAARHLAPGRLRRPPTALTAAQQAALPPRRHSLLQQGVALLRHLLLRGYLWACVWLGPTPGPDFRTTRSARQTILPFWSLPDLTLPLTVAPAMPGPVTRGASPPLQPPPPIPAQKIALSRYGQGARRPP